MLAEGDFESEQFDPERYINQLLSQAQIPLDSSSMVKSAKAVQSLLDVMDEIKNQLDNRKLKLQKELDTQITLTEINIENKQHENQELLKEFSNLKELYTEIDRSLESRVQDDPGIKLLHKGEKIFALELENEELIMSQEIFDHVRQYNSENTQQFPSIYIIRKPLHKAVQQLLVLKKVSEQLSKDKFGLAKKNISRVYLEMQLFLMSSFSEAFYKLDLHKIQELLEYIEQYELQGKVVRFYIEHTLSDLSMYLFHSNQEMSVMNNQKNKDFMIFRSSFNNYREHFKSLFRMQYYQQIQSTDQRGGRNYFSLSEIFQKQAPLMIQQFINYVFTEIVFCNLTQIQPIMQQLLITSQLEVYLQNFSYLHELSFNLVQSIQKIDHSVPLINLKEISNSFFQSLFEEFSIAYQEKEYKWSSEQLDQNVAKILSMLGKRGDADKISISNHKFQLRKRQQEDQSSWKTFCIKKKLNKYFRLYNNLYKEMKKQISLRLGKFVQFMKKKVQDKTYRKAFDQLWGQSIKKSDRIVINQDEQSTTETVPTLNRKTPVSEYFFEVIPQLGTLVQRIEVVCNQYLRDWNEQSQIQNLISKKEGLLKSLEMLINKAIQLALASIFINLKRILQLKQNKKDFSKKDLSKEPTQAAIEFCSFMNNYLVKIKRFSQPAIRQSILSSVGEQIISILVDHFQNYMVSLTGAFQLSIDMSAYKKLLIEFEDEQILQEFNVLEVLTNLFKISQKELKKYIEDEPLFRTLSKEVIQNYVEKREYENEKQFKRDL